MSDFIRTPEQETILREAINWYNNSSEQIFQFAGNPGTGKSVMMNDIIAHLNIPPERIAPMAYVGAAAINMRLKGLKNAKTIHSTIYDIEEEIVKDENGNIVMNKYFNRPEVRYRRIRKKLDNIDLFVIDEGGTVPMSMRKHITDYGKKILVAGDLDQLPPVSDTPAFLTTGRVHRLTQIMRQSEGSAIVYLCQRAKNGLPIHVGMYGDDVLVLEEKDFELNASVLLRRAEVILCGKNATREKWTNILRYNILGKRSNLPDQGEKLICKINDWNIEQGGINLTNGLTGIVMNQPDVSTFDGKCFYIDFLPDLTSIPFKNVAVDYKFFTSSIEEKKAMKNFNYCVGEAMEFGYCQTVNTAQGSQWNDGIYFEEFLPSNNNARNYTALSRFRKKCIYVKKNRKYY